MGVLDPDRLFPLDDRSRGLARVLFASVETLPIVSPREHCDPARFARDDPFPDPARRFAVPDRLGGLEHHRAVRDSGWSGRVLTAYRPDEVIDPDAPEFAANVARRVDCAHLAALVSTGRPGEAGAFELAPELAVELARRTCQP